MNGNITLRSKTMDMHILMVCDLLLENKNYLSIDEKLNYFGNYSNALNIFEENLDLLNTVKNIYLKGEVSIQILKQRTVFEKL